MIGWIALGVAVLALLLLVAVVLAPMRRLDGLRRALYRAQRSIDAQPLQNSVRGLQERLAEVQEHAMLVQNRLAEIKNSSPGQ